MDLRSITTAGIILGGRNLGETDRTLVVFTKDLGKITCLAKGVRKSVSKLKAITQQFTLVNLTLNASRSGLYIITQGEVLESWTSLREELPKIGCSSYLGELVDASQTESKANEEIFILLVTCLTLLDQTDEAYLVLKFFELRLLGILGYKPQLKKCCGCNHDVSIVKFYLSPAGGGIVCENCYNGVGKSLGYGSIMILDKIQNWELRQIFKLKINDRMKDEIDAAIACYFDYYMGAASKARKTLYLYYP